MSETFMLTVVTPEEIVLSEAVTMAVIPGEKGAFGVLPRHGALITSLKPGLLQTYEGVTIKHRLFLSDGFASVNENSCTILTEECVFIRDLEAASLETELKHALEAIGEARTAEERANHTYSHRLIRAKLDVLGRLSQ